VVAAVVIIVGWKIIANPAPFDVFVGSGFMGTIILIFAYILATIGAIKFLFFSGVKRTKQWEIVIPLAGLLVLAYTLYRNVVPFPASGPGRVQIIVSILWIAVGVIAVAAAPNLARKVGEKLTADENLSITK
jgi:hypothetical protein